MSLFQSSFQGGQFFEILTAQGANPTGNWKVVGTQKVLDKLLKGNVFICEGSSGLLQIPKDEKIGSMN